MARILVTTLPHEGHLNPVLAIAHALQARGHELIVLNHPLIQTRLRQEGFATVACRPFRPADLLILWRKYRLAHSEGKNELRNAMRIFTTRLLAQARYIQQLITDLQPALILNDVFHYASAMAAEKAGLPWVDCWTAGSMHPQAQPNLLPFQANVSDDLLRLFDARLNRARKAFGLVPAPAGAFLRPSQYLQLYTSCAEIEPMPDQLDDNAAFIGPCINAFKDAETEAFDWQWLQGKEPIVYVSLGTFFTHRPKFIKHAINAARGQNYKMLISSPLAGSRRFKALPSNVRICSRVPQAKLLAKVSLFVTHGGNNSVQEALTHGAPMLVTPVGAEQMYNAARVCWLGVGGCMDINKINAESFAHKISQLLQQAEYRQRTKAIAKKLERYNGPATAAELIQKLLGCTRRVEPS